MKKRAWFLSVLMVLVSLSLRAGIGTWRNFTAMKDVRGVTRSGDTYWAATSGGMFAWNERTNTLELFTSADGLQSIDLTAIGIDKTGNVWTGSATGIIHIYSPITHTWRYVLDIATANQSNKKINSFTMYGDTVLICTDFGLSIFKNNRFEFGDTYSKFGPVPSNRRIAVSAAIIADNKIWAAISDGQTTNAVAVASLSNPNLLPPESWTLQSVGGGAVATNLVRFNSLLYAATPSGLYRYDGTSWMAVTGLLSKNIVASAASTSVISVCASGNDIYTVDTQGNVLPYPGNVSPPALLPFAPTTVAVSGSGQPVVGTLGGGLQTYSGSWTSHLPNGPAASQFISVAIDPDGVVWGASGSANGSGFYRYNGKEWKSFTRKNSGLPTNDCYRVSIGCNGTLWASTWGSGVVEIPPRSDSATSNNFFSTNVGMVGLQVNPEFVVVSNVVCDNNGNEWMSVIQPANKNVFTVRRPDHTWANLPATISGFRVASLTDSPVDRCLAVDAFGSLWSIVRDGAYKGVLSLANRGSVVSVAPIHLTSTDGLPSDDIRTIVVDRDNNIWVGTDKGIGIILDPANPTRDGGIALYKPLLGNVINTIAVDPINQKWVGTPEGVVLLSPDGTQVLGSFTVASTNGKLVDNDIKSIAVDPNTGTVYFGTLTGLSSLSTAAAAARPSFAELRISPNPYIIPNPVLLTVDGLVDNSRMKILSIDGRLIRELSTPGGRIGFWDGNDQQGKPVSSGIYVVVAFSEDGNNVAKGKVAVLRR